MSATFYITRWLAIYFSEGAWSLDIGRFLTGYRIGVFSYVKSLQKSPWRAYNTKSGTIISWRTLRACFGCSLQSTSTCSFSLFIKSFPWIPYLFGKMVLGCQTYESGISGEPGSEAHGGYVSDLYLFKDYICRFG